MKNIACILIILSVFASSCSKDNTNSSNNNSSYPSFKWTYQGTTFTADAQSARGPNSAVSYSEIDGYRGSAASPSDGFTIHLNSLTTGSYSASQTNVMQSVSTRSDVDPFVCTITSNSGTAISGNFSGTYLGQSLTGTFVNVSIY
jgi:hypothetical protein